MAKAKCCKYGEKAFKLDDHKHRKTEKLPFNQLKKYFDKIFVTYFHLYKSIKQLAYQHVNNKLLEILESIK